MKVTVLPIQTINVRTNQRQQQTVTSTSQFVGSSNVQQEVNEIAQVADNAASTANSALIVAENANTRTFNEISNGSGSVIVQSDGSVLISGNTGIITQPTYGSIEITSNVNHDVTGLYLQDGDVAALYSNTDIILQSNESGATQTLVWTRDGNMQFPDNSLQNTAYVATEVLQVSGGEITGNLTIDGTFNAIVDGGRF